MKYRVWIKLLRIDKAGPRDGQNLRALYKQWRALLKNIRPAPSKVF